MGRRRYFHTLSAGLLSLFVAGSLSAQGNHGGRARHRGPGPAQFHGPPRMLHLSPEERQTFRRNAERWLQMNPQQQNALRQRENMLREQRRREAESFLRDSGLRLDNHSREEFEQRYLQERIRIERALRQEIEAKRQQELPQLRERLRNEFQGQQGPGGGPPVSPANPRND